MLCMNVNFGCAHTGRTFLLYRVVVLNWKTLKSFRKGLRVPRITVTILQHARKKSDEGGWLKACEGFVVTSQNRVVRVTVRSIHYKNGVFFFF